MENITTKPVFLLENSVNITLKPRIPHTLIEINDNDCLENLILNAVTESKSFAEPGDDDPDVEAEYCY